jgi:hypothetical protein
MCMQGEGSRQAGKVVCSQVSSRVSLRKHVYVGDQRNVKEQV